MYSLQKNETGVKALRKQKLPGVLNQQFGNFIGSGKNPPTHQLAVRSSCKTQIHNAGMFFLPYIRFT